MYTSHGEISLTPISSLCSQIGDVLSKAILGGKTRLTKKINSLLLSIKAIGKSCTLQWIPNHVDIEGNELAVFFFFLCQ